MGQGQGSFQTNAKFPPGGSPGPPFLLNSADNGLSVDPISKRIVLGQSIGAIGNPAGILDNREIPFNGFTLDYNDGPGPTQIRFNPSVPEIRLVNFGTLANGHLREFELFFNNSNGNINLDAAGPGPTLTLQGLLAGQDPRIIWDFGLVDQYQADWDALGTGNFSIGDKNGAVKILWNDVTELIQGQASDPIGQTAVFTLNALPGSGAVDATLFAGNGIGGASFLDVLSFPIFQSHLKTTDSINTAEFFLNADTPTNAINAKVIINSHPYLLIDFFGNVYQLGDISGVNNNSFLTVDDGIPSISASLSGSQYFALDNSVRSYSIGDLSGIVNGTQLSVNDTAGEFQLSNTGNTSKVRINGVIGFTGTVANPVTITVDGGIVTNVA